MSILLIAQGFLFSTFDYQQHLATSHHLTAPSSQNHCMSHLDHGSSLLTDGPDLIFASFNLFPSKVPLTQLKSISDRVPSLLKTPQDFLITFKSKSQVLSKAWKAYVTVVSLPLQSQFLLLFSLLIPLQSHWLSAVLQNMPHIFPSQHLWNPLLQIPSVACSFMS